VDIHTSTILTPAPSSSTSTTVAAAQPGSAVEWYIGIMVGGAAVVLLQAIEERAERGVTPRTRDQAGTIVAELCRIRYYLAGQQDFEPLAKRLGIAQLLATGDIPLATAEWAVDQVLTIVRKTMRAQAS
jgi:hypothetical protein